MCTLPASKCIIDSVLSLSLSLFLCWFHCYEWHCDFAASCKKFGDETIRAIFRRFHIVVFLSYEYIIIAIVNTLPSALRALAFCLSFLFLTRVPLFFYQSKKKTMKTCKVAIACNPNDTGIHLLILSVPSRRHVTIEVYTGNVTHIHDNIMNWNLYEPGNATYGVIIEISLMSILSYRTHSQ